MELNHFAIVIPCYNVGKLCSQVIEKSLQFTSNLIAVNDGSTDETAAVLAQYDITVLTHSRNEGKGMALRTGFAHLLQNSDFQAVITLDADGQHDPGLLARVAEPIQSGAADMVIGSRQFIRAEMPLKRYAANTVSSFIISKLLRTGIRDIQSGFRVYNRATLQAILSNIQSTGFEIETEMLILALQLHARIVEVPIPSVYSEEANQSSSWRALSDSARIGKMVLRYLLTKNE